jgi:hypothetical protein
LQISGSLGSGRGVDDVIFRPALKFDVDGMDPTLSEDFGQAGYGHDGQCCVCLGQQMGGEAQS